ncbi:MAG: GtrA family protein [Acidimicrobiales bacterium]
MRLTPSDLLALAKSPEGKKMIRYSATSVICVVLSFVILAFLVGVLQWSATSAAIVTCAVTTIPSYVLNRRWAWGMSGTGHVLKEVVPFWVMAFIGLAFSTWTSSKAQVYARHHDLSRLPKVAIIEGAFIGAFGVLWIGKFLIINRLLFTGDGSAAGETATDGAARSAAATVGAGGGAGPDPSAVAG